MRCLMSSCRHSDAVVCGTLKTIRLELQVMDELHVLMERPDPAEVVVVGGGYAGVELAATVAEKLAGKGQVKVKLSCNSGFEAESRLVLHVMRNEGCV